MSEARIKIRGIGFAGTGPMAKVGVAELAGIYLVMKALDGDELAQDILDASGKVIFDNNGKQIYPPVVREHDYKD